MSSPSVPFARRHATPADLGIAEPIAPRPRAVLCDASVARIDAAFPELIARYGDRGRQFTAEDNLWHLNYLDLALALRDPSRFAKYADWLADFLLPRGLEYRHIAGAFTFLAEGLDALDCPAEWEAHRREFIGMLTTAAAAVLARPPADADGSTP